MPLKTDHVYGFGDGLGVVGYVLWSFEEHHGKCAPHTLDAAGRLPPEFELTLPHALSICPVPCVAYFLLGLA